MFMWLRKRLESSVEASILRENERLKSEVRDREEDLRIARHDLVVEQSHSDALRQQVEFLELANDAATRRVETMIARLGYETGKMTS